MTMTRHLWTKYTPEDCVRLLREGIQEERWRWQGQRYTKPFRGWMLGRSFRLVLFEERPWTFHLSERRAQVLYGTIRPDIHTTGSEVVLWETPRLWDPLCWAIDLPVILLTFLLVQGMLRAMTLVFIAFGLAVSAAFYENRRENWEELSTDLRWFVRKTLAAEERRGKG